MEVAERKCSWQAGDCGRVSGGPDLYCQWEAGGPWGAAEASAGPCEASSRKSHVWRGDLGAQSRSIWAGVGLEVARRWGRFPRETGLETPSAEDA